MGVSWFRGEHGAVFTLSPPFPADVDRRLAAGLITRIPPQAPERPAEPPGGGEVPVPNRGASRAEWEAYALTQGMDPATLADMTRNQIANATGTVRAVKGG